MRARKDRQERREISRAVAVGLAIAIASCGRYDDGGCSGNRRWAALVIFSDVPRTVCIRTNGFSAIDKLIGSYANFAGVCL